MKLKDLDNFKRQLAGHRLELVQQGERVTAYYLRDPKQGLMMSTLIVFTPEGIALMGDLTPERNGSISSRGYGIGWFSSHKSDSYLCEKFLEQKWVPELAKESLRDRQYWRDYHEIEDAEKLDAIAELAQGIDDTGPHQLRDDLEEIVGQIEGEDMPGWGYDPGEAAWLIAIQARFAELWPGPAPLSRWRRLIDWTRIRVTHLRRKWVPQ